jgi:hypothetical protein
VQREWPQCIIPLDALSCPDGLSIWSGWHLQSFGDNYVADNSDGAAAAGLEINSRTGSLDALRIFLDIC